MRKDKNRKLRGSVLLTVVFVMSILIIFLFGTMALAIAANNRAHVNYSSAQTGITARAVAESAIKAIANSSEAGKQYALAVGKLESGEIPVNVQLKGDGSGTLGEVENVVISHAGTKMYYDVEKKGWFERDLLRFTATVNMAGVRSSSSVYVLKHYQEDSQSDSGGGAGFVTTADAVFNTQTSLFGGSYISLPTPEKAQEYDSKYLLSYDERMENRTFREADGTDNEIPPLSLYNSDAVIEADLFVNNDVTVENWSGVVFPDKGKGITIWGDLYFKVNSGDHFKYECNNLVEEELPFNKVPYIYVDGDITGEKGAVALGSENQNFPMNTFCASIKAGEVVDGVTDGKDSIIASNIYCMDENRDSVIRGLKNPGLYTWSKSVIAQVKNNKRVTVVKGEICSKGNLELGEVEINGDVRVEGNLKIRPGVKVKGNVVCKGTIEGIENLECEGVIFNDTLAAGSKVVTITFPNNYGYFYEYNPKMVADEENIVIRHVGPHGFNISDEIGVFTEGVYNGKGMVINDHTLPDAGTDVTMYYTLEQGWKQSDEDSINHITTDEPYYYFDAELEKYLVDVPKNPEELEDSDEPQLVAVVPGFYIKTDVQDFKKVNPGDNTDGYETIDIEGETYMYKLVSEYIKTEEKNFTKTFALGAAATGKNIALVNDFYTAKGEETVYPKYAERKVILGLDSTLAPESTKIVRTVSDVLKEVSNPYQAQQLPEHLISTYDSLVAENKPLKSKGAVLDKFSNDTLLMESNAPHAKYVINGKKYNSVGKNDPRFHTNQGFNQSKWDSDRTNSAAAYITGNCILEDLNFGNGDVIINPGADTIVIAIRGNVGFNSGSSILVDDSGGGDVYFYIEPGAHLAFNGNNLCTKTYWDAFAKTNKFSFGKVSGEGYQKIEELGHPCPNVFVYGGQSGDTKSELTIMNMDIMTMNVISPNIKTNVGGGTGNMIQSLLYNGYETAALSKQYIIGCFNVNEVSPSQNQLAVVYVPDGGGDPPVIGDHDKEFWYKILYYSEF